MDKEVIIEVVKRLIGPVRPVGETRTDADRLENLKKAGAVVDYLLEEIGEVATINKDRVEYSRKSAAEEALEILEFVKEHVENTLLEEVE